MSTPATDAPTGTEGAAPPPTETTTPPTTTTPPAGGNAKDPGDLDGLKAALKAERDARRTAEERAKELEPYESKHKEAEEAGKSELTKANESLATEREARTKAEAALLRYQVGAEKSVPPKLVPYLTGGTKEEIEASADVLLGELGGSTGNKSVIPGRPTERMATGEPSSSLDDEDPMTLIAKARGQDTKRG